MNIDRSTSQAAAVPNVHKSSFDPKGAKLVDAAGQFEASLISEMLKPLNFGAAADEGAETSPGGAVDTIRGLGTDALAKALSQHGGLGIGRKIVQEVNAEYQARTKAMGGSKVI